MTSENLDIVLSNALCCIAQKAVIVSDLLSKGDKCFKSKIKELKILNDSVDALLCNAYEETTCLTEDQINNLINNVMTICDICHCQLTE